MIIEGFDYRNFAFSLYRQAIYKIPKKFKGREKRYISYSVHDYTYRCGQVFCECEEIYSLDDVRFMTQLLSEWIFHKAVDLTQSGLNKKSGII